MEMNVFRFCICLKNGKQYVFMCNNESDRNKWINGLNKYTKT